MSGILEAWGRIGSAIHGRLLLVVSVATLIAAAVLPQAAAAEAVMGAEPSPGAAGLPDGRVYEEVSPANKHGNEVEYNAPASVSSNGQAIMYGDTGTIAEEPASNTFVSPVVSERTSDGWKTRSTMPLPREGVKYPEEYVTFATLTEWDVASADLSHFLFNTGSAVPYAGPPDEPRFRNNLYLEGPDPFAEPEWVGRSLIEGSPSGEGGKSGSRMFVAGASPDLKAIYYYYEANLLPGASGLYEYRDGILKDAGTMPEGESSTGAAAPAAQPLIGKKTVWGVIPAGAYDNQVSADGSRIFFTRTDAAGALELYAHTTSAGGAESTELVSQSQLPGHMGEPAPGGVLAVATTERDGDGQHPEAEGQEGPPSYVFASQDGTRAFFQSTDRLTAAAPEDGTPKSYVLDLATGQLEYLSWLSGSIVTTNGDGSAVVFENTSASPYELERWVLGPAGGTVEPLAQLPAVTPNPCGTIVCVGPAFTSADGEVVVFTTESDIPGFNDGGTHYRRSEEYQGEQPELASGALQNQEVFRYDGQTNELSCISCPSKGVTPTSNASTSWMSERFNVLGATAGKLVASPGRAMNSGGTQVYFETREALMPQDINGGVDVYEWEHGNVYLVSSGLGQRASRLLGTSESGQDTFFTTTEGIAPGDTDGGLDVYDARIPRPGDRPAPAAVPCTGAVCQGPPSVPNLLGPPASEVFNGPGDLTPVLSLNHVHKSKKGQRKKGRRRHKRHKASKHCKSKHHGSGGRRSRCVHRAPRNGAHSSVRRARHGHDNRNRRDNGRGK